MSRKALKEARLDACFSFMSEDLEGIDRSERVNFAVARLRERAQKRALYHNPSLKSEAWEKFLRINTLVGEFRPRNTPLLREARDFIHHVLSILNGRAENGLGELVDWECVVDNWRFGPGASNGVKGTHTAQKIYESMTVTRSAEPLIRDLRSRNPYFNAWDGAKKGGTALVDGSRMTTVPKSKTAVRTIAIEPSGNMALQLAVGRFLEDSLRAVGLDIKDQQPINKRLARRGSQDGSLATLDLSSASDMISPYLVRELFPYQWYMLFMRLRSPQTEIPGYGSVKLNMISTMGNGFTFPLMTLIIVAMIYSYRRVLGLAKRVDKKSNKSVDLVHYVDWSHTGVFGDDIIVPTAEYEICARSLTEFGLVVNSDKSYSSGPFRESCGGDYFEGYDVTPFYVKSLAKTSEVYVVINQVLGYCARHNIVMYRTLRYLWSLVDNKPFLVPEWHNPDQGVLTRFLPSRRYKYLRPLVVGRALKDEHFLMPLAIAGYVEGGATPRFTPRPLYSRYEVKRARLPEGYLDGRCADRYSEAESSFVGLIIQLIR